MLENNSQSKEIPSRPVNDNGVNPWSEKILDHFINPKRRDDRYILVPDIMKAEILADELNKKDSQSLLSAYEKMSLTEKQKFELYSDKDGNLRIRLSEKFKQEAYAEFREQALFDAFTRQDIEALNQLAPFRMSEQGQLIDRLRKSGWKVEESISTLPGLFFDQRIVFTPPDGKQAIAWVQYSCPTIDGAGDIIQRFELF